MCTVSFLRDGNSVVFTSNRDEHISRPSAYRPREESLNGVRVLFPKDPKAGGTWFAVNDRHVVSVLLNGAFKRHSSNGQYRKSRGLVLLDVIGSKRPKDTLMQINLDRIEPFTIVLFQEQELFEFRWDSSQKYLKQLDTSRSMIWSSTTLYSEEVILAREKLFEDFLNQNKNTDANSALEFHSNDFDDSENGFIISRENGLRTFSITQAIIDTDLATLRHIDLQNDKDYTLSISNRQPMGLL